MNTINVEAGCPEYLCGPVCGLGCAILCIGTGGIGAAIMVFANVAVGAGICQSESV